MGVLSVDHGLRPEAVDEVAGVAARAGELGLRAHTVRLAVAPGPGVQARARRARLQAAQRCADEHGYRVIATGHTASDQAETVLFRLARGTGRTGALGMAPRRDEFVRPLLVLSAAETRAWCARRGLAVVADPSNEDAAYARSRVRSGLVPALAAVHPGAERHVAALADALRDESDLLAPLIDAAWARVHDDGGLGALALAREAPAMRRILVRRLVERAGLPADAASATAVARILGLMGRPSRISLPGDGIAALESGRLVVEPPPGPAPRPAPLGVPGRAEFGGARAEGPARSGMRPGTRPRGGSMRRPLRGPPAPRRRPAAHGRRRAPRGG